MTLNNIAFPVFLTGSASGLLFSVETMADEKLIIVVSSFPCLYDVILESYCLGQSDEE